ncbi:MAG: alcohol dehydrogenase catalytic domain-containing protein, partial [Pseudomonadota bacterium]
VMKAAVIERFEAPLVIRDVEVPAIGPEEVLVRVRACGICGTDLKIISGQVSKVSLPHIPGHEIAGEVCEVGDQVKEVSIGDRVAVYSYLTCGQCRYCQAGRDSLCENLKGQVGTNLAGGMADFVKVPASNVLRTGSSIPFPQAALLNDAVSTPYHALRSRAELKEGDVLVIVGVGGLGLHAVQIAKILGAKVFSVDINDRHLEKAAELGADVVLNPNRDDVAQVIYGESGRHGADVVMDLVGQPETLEQDLEWLCPGGKLLVVGYNLTRTFSVLPHTMITRELEILGCRSKNRREVAEVIRWVEEKKIIPVVDELYSLARVNEAYDRLRSGEVMGRVVVEP